MKRAELLRTLSLGLVFLAPFALTSAALPGAAQDRMAIEAFEPATDQDGSILSVAGARTRGLGQYSFSVLGSYARRPLSVADAQDKRLADLVGSVGTLQLVGTVGLARRFDVGFGVPLHRVSAGSDYEVTPPREVQAATLSNDEVALGDIRLVPRVNVVAPTGERGFALAALVPLWLPTGNDDAYAGEPFRFEPRIALGYQSPEFHLAANVGYLVRKQQRIIDAKVDDMLSLGVGTEVAFGSGLSGIVELDSQLGVQADDFGKKDAPLEGLLGLRYRHAGLLAQLGGGTGLIRGISAPEYRVFAGLGYAGPAVEPERDRDHDGVLDNVDKCIDAQEDKDGFQDEDGCPEVDNDGDGIPDERDACPQVSEDADGFQDEDGCVDDDNDRDAIADATDKCPNEAEEKDGFEDEDGCPELDNDRDGVPDADDRCPNEVGVIEEQGCPAPPAASKVTVTDEKVEFAEKIYFGLNSAVIEERSFPLLDEIARVLNEHTEVELVVVEGHTDSTGKRFRNEQLAAERAASVRKALIERSVSENRLKSEGFGSRKPLVENDTEENRAQNRRVELRIERRADRGSI